MLLPKLFCKKNKLLLLLHSSTLKIHLLQSEKQKKRLTQNSIRNNKKLKKEQQDWRNNVMP